MNLLDKVKKLIANMQRAIEALKAVKTAILANGVELPEGTTADKYGEKVNEVYIAGKNDILRTMWNCITNYRDDYHRAFYYQNLDKTTFKAVLMNIKNATSMFENCSRSLETDRQVEETQQIMNFKGCKPFTKAFYNCGLFKTLYCIDLSSATSTTFLFAHSNIQRIERLIVSENKGFDNEFTDATSLYYVGFFNSVIGNKMNFQWSPLNPESMKNIILCLKDYSGTDYEFKYNITFSEECWAALAADGSTSPHGNSWTDYCNDIKWNT